MSNASVEGFVNDRFTAVRDVFANNLASGADLGASFSVTLAGETVVDLWGGFADEARNRPWAQDTIVNVHSTTKTMTALTALLLADRRLHLRHAEIAAEGFVQPAETRRVLAIEHGIEALAVILV